MLPEWEPHQLTLMAWPCRAETYTFPERGCDGSDFGPAKFSTPGWRTRWWSSSRY